MTQKRYAIVRVDNICPEYVEDFKCHFPDNSVECMKCNHHRYGDTKEQLINKVAQALKRTLWNDKESKTYEEIAKEIVEFLGVE